VQPDSIHCQRKKIFVAAQLAWAGKGHGSSGKCGRKGRKGRRSAAASSGSKLRSRLRLKLLVVALQKPLNR
jgi:hypothetical protein